jgi:hypothetical protein
MMKKKKRPSSIDFEFMLYQCNRKTITKTLAQQYWVRSGNKDFT